MSDLRVVAILKAKPGSEQVISEALAELATATREEEGCFSYELFVSAAEPTTFITIETWRTKDDLDAHLQTPHVQQAIAAGGEHMSAAPDIHPLAPVG